MTVTVVPAVSLASRILSDPLGDAPAIARPSIIAGNDCVVDGTPPTGARSDAAIFPSALTNAVAELSCLICATPSAMPVGHASPGLGPTVVVAVRVSSTARNSYDVFAAGVNAMPVTSTAVALLVEKSAPSFT